MIYLLFRRQTIVIKLTKYTVIPFIQKTDYSSEDTKIHGYHTNHHNSYDDQNLITVTITIVDAVVITIGCYLVYNYRG